MRRAVRSIKRQGRCVVSEPSIYDFAIETMTATVRNLAEIKNVPLAPDRFHQVVAAALDTLSLTDIYGLGKAHRGSVLVASAAVNRCLDIIAATRMAIATARREGASGDIDAVVAKVQGSPDRFIPAEAKGGYLPLARPRGIVAGDMMLQPESFISDHRTLVRRFKFRGLPGEKQGGLTYAALRSELGDNGAACLVMHLVAVARSREDEHPGVPAHITVGRLLNSMTQDERRLAAKGPREA
jgi:alkylhydroperoxidase family enzyme